MEKRRKELINLIINTYVGGSFPKNVEDEFHVWLIDEADSESKDEVLFNVWNEIKVDKQNDTDKAFSAVKRRLNILEVKKYKNIMRKLKGIAAAVIPIAILMTLLYYNNSNNRINIEENVISQVIIPSEDELYIHAVLDDCSKVWVKNGGVLQYDSDRKAELKGEAFFHVTKNSDKSFVVKTKFINVSVLGTKFNIHAYPDNELTVISLYEGELNVEGEKLEINLNGGDELVYNQISENYFIRKISGSKPDWLKNTIGFERSSLETIFEELEQLYGVTFIYDKSLFQGHYLSFKFEEDTPVADIISNLCLISGKFNYTIKDDRIITVKPKY